MSDVAKNPGLSHSQFMPHEMNYKAKPTSNIPSIVNKPSFLSVVTQRCAIDVGQIARE